MKKLALAAATAVALTASGASAATLSGEYWDLPSNSISNINQAIAAVASLTTTATFDATDINYGDSANNWRIASLTTFLAGDSGSITGTDDGNMQESVFRIFGKVSLNDGDQINVTSDDGFRLIIGGNTFSEFLGIRAPNNTTSGVWAGGSGIFEASLWYFEGQETQAQLKSNLVAYAAPVPVPASAFLLISAIGGIAAMRRRKKA